MNSNKKALSLYKASSISIVLSICLFISSCATITNKDVVKFNKFYSQLNKKSEMFKNNGLEEVNPGFWFRANPATVYVISGDSLFVAAGTSGTITSAFVGEVFPIVGGMLDFGDGARFNRKVENRIASHDWKIHDYFISSFKKEFHLPSNLKVSYITKENGVIVETEDLSSLKISDEDIIIFLSGVNLYMFGDFTHFQAKRIPLHGEVGVTIISGKGWKDFIKEYNGYLPVATTLPVGSDYKREQYSELRKISPDMYMLSVTMKTESYLKSKWLSEGGIFLEEQFKSMLEGLAKASAELIRKGV